MALVLAAGLVVARQQAGHWQFLLLQAKYGDNHWSPPKTNLNSGEQFLDGVYRALNEKTGFNRGDVQLFTNFKEKVTYKAFGNDKEVTYTLGKYTGTNGDNVQLHEKHKAFKTWVSKSTCFNKEVTYTLGKYTGTNGDNVQLHGTHKAFKWAPFNEARELDGYQNMRDLLDKVNAELLKQKK